jgi:hypothetical protein
MFGLFSSHSSPIFSHHFFVVAYIGLALAWRGIRVVVDLFGFGAEDIVIERLDIVPEIPF